MNKDQRKTLSGAVVNVGLIIFAGSVASKIASPTPAGVDWPRLLIGLAVSVGFIALGIYLLKGGDEK